jgi:hypothetical protein
MIVEALAERARTHPGEWEQRLRQIVDLAAGRPFAYPSSSSGSWRWADLEMLHATWETRIATAACELGRYHLERSEPLHAVEVANQGLTVDPRNSALIEVLMAAYADLGAYDKAKQIYEAHDRALADADLGGASEETRRLLDRLSAAAASSGTDIRAVG